MTHEPAGMRLREAALAVAIGECVNAIREEGGENKGEKVRAYLRGAEIPVPAPWCFTGDVEILTAHGFYRFDELPAPTRVAQVHPDDRTVSFVSPIARIQHRFRGDLITADSRDFGFTCDARHRFWGRWHGMKSMEKRPLSALSSRLAIPRIRGGSSANSDWSTRDLALLAMFLADGSLHRGKISVRVSRAHKLDRIRGLGPAHEYTAPEAYGISTKPLTTFEFGKPPWFDSVFAGYKRPRYDLLLALSAEQLQHFVEAYACFDGNAASLEGRQRSHHIYTSDAYLRDWLQAAVTLAGWHSSFHTRDEHGGLGDKKAYTVTFATSKRTRTLRGDQLVRHRGSRDLYCVEVPTGLIVCRDPKGTVFVTGNCAAFVQWATDGAAAFLSFENPLDAVHREALVADYMALSEQKGWTVPPDRAEPGDLVCYKFSSEDRWDHIGFVLSKPRRVEGRFNWMAVEGNTSPGVGLSEDEREREGDGVYKKRRRFRENRTAFIAWDDQLVVEW